ncbi:MAG: hypothetical protein BGP01_04340 [Paludibacter sp. 47-17]|jgi:hypothetical protein|nr:MAG: hypothetical protein BGP01_04340 [Paludibacter sp. 47-17]
MIIVGIKNGLGNQMFQYAFGKVLEWKYNIPVEFDIMNDDFVSGLQTDMEVFETGDYRVADKSSTKVFMPFSVARYRLEKKYTAYIYYKLRRIVHPAKLITERFPSQYCIHFEHLDTSRRYYFMGHWMNLRYFSGFEERIRALFELKDKSFYQSDIAQEIVGSLQTPVSLHIRRGDYLGSNFIGAAEAAYYQRAIALIREKVESPVLYVFTNDLDWVEQEFKPGLPYKIVNGNSGADSYKDMVLMSLCKHNIIANSSFSWWGAWLNKNSSPLVICPLHWYTKDSMNRYVSEMIPFSWIRI